jgi:hypothetical protein
MPESKFENVSSWIDESMMDTREIMGGRLLDMFMCQEVRLRLSARIGSSQSGHAFGGGVSRHPLGGRSVF